MQRERRVQVVLGEAERADGLLRFVLEAEGFDLVGMASNEEELSRVLRGAKPSVRRPGWWDLGRRSAGRAAADRRGRPRRRVAGRRVRGAGGGTRRAPHGHRGPRRRRTQSGGTGRARRHDRGTGRRDPRARAGGRLAGRARRRDRTPATAPEALAEARASRPGPRRRRDVAPGDHGLHGDRRGGPSCRGHVPWKAERSTALILPAVGTAGRPDRHDRHDRHAAERTARGSTRAGSMRRRGRRGPGLPERPRDVAQGVRCRRET